MMRPAVAPPADARPLGSLGRQRALAVEAARIVRQVLRDGRARRTAEAVQDEYDAGYWTRIRNGKAWAAHPDVRSFVAAGTGRRVAMIDGRLVDVGDADYYGFRADLLAAILRADAGGGGPVAELGCGYGMNMFALASRGWPGSILGLDISPAGIETGREIAAHFGLAPRLSFAPLNLLEAADPSWRLIEGSTVFTYYCLEQLPRSLERVLRNILAARVRRVLHIEATPELWEWSSARDLVSRLYAWSRDYQGTLLTTLRRLEGERLLRVTRVERLGFAPTVRYDPTLICWEPA